MGVQGLQLGRALLGRVLGGKFRLRSYIGAGSSGTVYQADQVALGRTVAVKILNPELANDARLVSRFHDEALAASRLNHPNTVSVIDYGQAEDGLLYIVMEFLRGVTLTRVIEEESPLSVERIVDLAGQILSCLEDAHEAGVEPGYMGLGPIPASRKALARAGLTARQIDLAEINEAFAAQAVPCVRALELDPATVNVNGGAIALGHPLGATGAMILGTLVDELARRDQKRGLATLCVGGGMGIATIVELV